MKISALYITNPATTMEYLITVCDDDTLSIERLYSDGVLFLESVRSEYYPLSLFICPSDIITELWNIEL